MFVKVSLHDRLICFVDFVGLTLLAVLFLLPLPNCFLRVCLRTLFAAVLKFFLPLTTSANYGTANSNKSALKRFAAGTIYLRKNGIAVLPITCASAPSPRPRCRPLPLQKGISFSSRSNNLLTSFRLQMNVRCFPENQNKTSDTDRYKEFFFTARVSQINVNTLERTFEQQSGCKLL